MQEGLALAFPADLIQLVLLRVRPQRGNYVYRFGYQGEYQTIERLLLSRLVSIEHDLIQRLRRYWPWTLVWPQERAFLVG